MHCRSGAGSNAIPLLIRSSSLRFIGASLAAPFPLVSRREFRPCSLILFLPPSQWQTRVAAASSEVINSSFFWNRQLASSRIRRWPITMRRVARTHAPGSGCPGALSTGQHEIAGSLAHKACKRAKHPLDVGDLKDVICTDCHTGGVGPQAKSRRRRPGNAQTPSRRDRVALVTGNADPCFAPVKSLLRIEVGEPRNWRSR